MLEGNGWTLYENEDKYSVTTSKHRSQAHPQVKTFLRTKEWMLNMLKYCELKEKVA
jgi:hypothetical protein